MGQERVQSTITGPVWRRAIPWVAAGVCLAGLLVGSGTLSARQILMAPRVELTFDQLTVSESSEAINLDYQLAARDWRWTHSLGLQVWVGMYTAGADGSWKLRQAVPMADKEDTAAFDSSIAAGGAGRRGICLITASEGGKLAAGMGYVCQRPVPVDASERSPWTRTDVDIAMDFQDDIDEQPWFTDTRGLTTDDFSTPTHTTAGGFISYRPPQSSSPPNQVPSDASNRSAHSRPAHPRRACTALRRPAAPRYGYGYIGGVVDLDPFFERNRYTFDRYRHRRLQRRRFFGPLDPFDAKFDQDMFTGHPEGAFGRFRLPPGYFGRDAFGRDLHNGFGAPRRLRHNRQLRRAPRPGKRGLLNQGRQRRQPAR